jgi:hypothetical protein
VSTEFLVAIIIAIPVILFPVAFLWFFDVSGVYNSWKARRAVKRPGTEKPGK